MLSKQKILPMDFSFTYKLNKSPREDVTREEYDIVLRHISECGGEIRFVYYELDDHSHFHIHGLAMFKGEPSYKKLTLFGFTSRWYHAWDVAGWEKYCKKDVIEDEEDDKDELGIISKSLFPKVKK